MNYPGLSNTCTLFEVWLNIVTINFFHLSFCMMMCTEYSVSIYFQQVIVQSMTVISMPKYLYGFFYNVQLRPSEEEGNNPSARVVGLTILDMAKKIMCVFTVTRPTLSIFSQNSDNHFCCLISSNVLFIQLLAFCRNWEQRRKKNCVTLIKQLQNKWRLTGNFENEISDSGTTTISGLADS